MNYLKTDLLKDNILKSLIIFAVPLMLANFFQQLYNTVDTVIVGNILGDTSLAAIGSASPLYELLVGFALGVGNGMSIAASRFFGMGDRDRLRQAAAGSLVIGALLTAAVMLISHFGLYSFLRLLGTPAQIIDESYSYISFVTMFVGVMFLYNLCAGMLRAVGDSVTPLIFLVFSSLLNILLDYIFVKYTAAGILGAAAATVISQAVSSVLCIIFILKKCRILVPSKKHFRPERSMYCELAGQGFSMGFMMSIVSLGTVILQYSVNGFGKLIIAGHTAARRLSYFCMMPPNTLGLAFSTFVGQNCGAGNYERIKQGIRTVNLLSLAYAAVLTLIIFIAAPWLISLISGSSEPELIEYGSLYMKMNVPFYPVVGVVFNLRNALQGLGRKVVPLVASILECIGKIIFVALLNPRIGLFGVIICEPAIWIVMAVQLIYSIRHDGLMTGKERLSDKKPVNRSGRKQMLYRLIIYSAGMIILACGITMNTKTGLGVSPIISVPYTVSQICNLDFGNTTLVVYVIFIIIQAALMRRITAKLLLQLPLSLFFTRFLNLFERIIPESGPQLYESIPMLLAAVGLTGLGIVLSVRTELVPNPGDGIVNEIAAAINKSMGFTKNCFDLLSLCISVTAGLVFTGHIIGIGVGTVLTMLLTGRAVALFSFCLLKPMLRLCGLNGGKETGGAE